MNFEDTLCLPHYKPGSPQGNEYRQTTVENDQKKKNRIFGTSNEEFKIQIYSIYYKKYNLRTPKQRQKSDILALKHSRLDRIQR